jgi:hypothetical protein
MGASYRIVVRRRGVTQLDLPSFHSLEYVLVENDVGALQLVMPGPTPFSSVLTERDTEIEIYRTEDSITTLEGGKPFLVRDAQIALSPSGEYLQTITAVDTKHLLKRRIVAYAAGTSQSRKASVRADDMMKAIVRENMGVSASAARAFVDFGVDADESNADFLTKSFAWRNVLTVLQEIANANYTGAPTTPRYISFDVVLDGDGTLRFRTFMDQRGIDRSLGSGNALILSPELGTLADALIKNVTLNEVTSVVVGGPGEESLRLTTTVTLANVASLSYFNYIEDFADARNGGASTAGLEAEGYALLQEKRGRRLFRGRVVQTDAVRYGVHWRWGDVVAAQFAGQTIDDCRIDRVRVRITPDAGEQIEAELLADQPLN